MVITREPKQAVRGWPGLDPLGSPGGEPARSTSELRPFVQSSLVSQPNSRGSIADMTLHPPGLRWAPAPAARPRKGEPRTSIPRSCDGRRKGRSRRWSGLLPCTITISCVLRPVRGGPHDPFRVRLFHRGRLCLRRWRHDPGRWISCWRLSCARPVGPTGLCGPSPPTYRLPPAHNLCESEG